ncbi:Ig-like domain-containing protein [Paenibacillus sp. BSR1-1]|uniref:Ig-like domain-containing protein n=1 Tax=Paenibacillus sp. BSR1-1 TaxID=3020845 RepID=UPI0025B061BE|nr:Ig-like domain-containing protein [Paenibacillus sp. BSR1-1]MDN3017993.1 Ig-like domain-containing protein [Paenibacillus sp. BSR1-1]
MGKKFILLLICLMLSLPGAGLASGVDNTSSQTSIKSANTNSLTNQNQQTQPKLSIETTQEPSLESYTVTPSEARVGDIITITAKINSPSYVIDKVQAEFYGETDKIIDMKFNSTDGTWTGTYQIKEYDHQGYWHLDFLLFSKEYWWFKYAQAIKVINPNEDRVGPQVNSITMEPQTVKAGEPFKVTVKAADNIGMKSVKADFVSPDGSIWTGKPLTYDSSKDEWYFIHTFEGNTKPGDWKLQIQAKDIPSNVTTVNKNFQLTNELADFTPPKVDNITINKQEVKIGDELKVTANITDDKSGVATAELRICDVQCYQSPFSKNPATGLWETTLRIDRYMLAGTYQIDIQVYDKAGNLTYPKIDQVLKLVNPEEDYTAPELTNFQVTPQTAKLNEEIHFSATVADKQSSVQEVSLYLFNLTTYQNRNVNLIFNKATGKWEGSYRVQLNDAPGVWRIDVHPKDTNSNEIVILGVSQITIDNPNADLIAPAKPIVNEVTDIDTTVTGQAEPGSIVTVKSGGSNRYTAIAGADGKFVVKIPAQWADSPLYVTATDIAGNTSEETTIFVVKARLSGWVKKDGYWYYYDPTTHIAKTGWLKVGTAWYYFNGAGIMQTGWLKSGSAWYYLNSSGAMATGWLKVNSVWYYFKSSGAMLTGWLKLGTKWYYFNPSGGMMTGSVRISGKTYYFDKTGALK